MFGGGGGGDAMLLPLLGAQYVLLLNYQVFDGAQTDGETVQYCEYTADVLTKKEGYDSLDYSDPENPDLHGAKKIWSYTYDTDGTTIKEKEPTTLQAILNRK